MTAFDEAMREALVKARERERASFGWDALLWLAVVPEWTEDLAAACGFPVDEPLVDWVARSEAEGLCESRLELGEDGLPRLAFLMPAAARADILAAAGTSEQAEVAALLAARIGEADAGGVVARWAELARSAPYRLGDALTRSANAAVAARDTPALLDWIAAGEALVPVFGGELASAVARAQRQLNLIYRARQDERVLAGFVRRADQIAAVERLLRGPDAEWALHLVGLGGSGKTMLLRYVGALLAGERDLGRLVVARVDFDYIPPSFPFERPAELLVRLCDGLAQHVQDQTQEALLETFVRAKRDADDALGGLGGDPQERIMQAPLQRVLDAFAGFAASLGNRVLLVLDTCEELAKLHAGEEAVPSVEAMWLLMTETQRRIPGVRVLLAGRRLLAAADADGPYELLPGLTTSFADRPYLRTFEIRGFRREEARQLLERAGARDSALVDAVLAGARELGRSPGVRGGAEGPAPDRYNPFDLNLYAAWLRANPQLSVEDVAAADTDAYVEARIVARLKDDGVDAALPAISVLARFDLAMLAPTLPAGVDPRRVMAVLSEQEWVDSSGGHIPETLILDVEPHLLPRLARYCERRRPEALAVARSLALHMAVRLLADAPLEPLGVERADLALRLAEPKSAAATWGRLEERIVAAGEWEWAIGACTRLLADAEDPQTGEVRPRHVPVRAHVLATLVSARGHRSRPAPFDEAWWRVLDWAAEHADPDVAAWLIARAAAQIAGEPGSARSAEAQALRDDALSAMVDPHSPAQAWRHEQLAATEIAALTRRADAAPDTPLSRQEHERIARYADSAPAPLGVAARLLACRLSVGPTAGSWSKLRARAAAVEPGGAWLDWVPPASMADRVELEWLLRSAAEGASAADFERRLEALPPPRWTVDQERLASLTALGILAHAVGPEEFADDRKLQALLDRAHPQPYAPECLAHRRVAPWFITIARAHLAQGRATAALELLRGRQRRYESARSADERRADAGRAARREIVAVLRRMRVPDSAVAGADPKRAGVSPEEAAETAAAAVLVLGPGSVSLAGLEPHARWRVGVAAPDGGLVDDLRRAAGEPGLDAETAQHLRLDLQEARRMAPGAFSEGEGLPPSEELTPRGADPAFAFGWARVNLRRFALGSSTSLPGATKALPPRRLGELALEEGELLALRLPSEARKLLDVAHTCFDRADDRRGALIAAIAHAGAALRAGELEDGRRLLEQQVRPAYGRVGSLPAWDETFAEPDPEQEWAGWLLRLRACRLWAAGSTESFGAAPELRAGGRPGGATRPAPAPSEPPEPSGSRTSIAWPAFAGVAAGAAAIAVVALLLHVAGGVLVVVAVSGLVAVLANRLLERGGLIGAVYRVNLDVAPDDQSHDFVRVRAASSVRGLRLTLRREEAVFSLGPPADGGANERIMTRFLERRLRKGKMNPAIDLRVAPVLAGHPWEGRLLPFAREGKWRAGWAPNIARRLPPAAGGASAAGLVIVAPERWRLLASRPWAATDATTLELAPDAAPRLALLIGAGVQTPGGPRLLLDAERLTTVSEATVSTAAKGDEELLDPEAVLAARPEIVFILAAPGSADPDSTGALRTFGAALAAGTPRAVLVVPGLPPDVAAAAVEVVAGSWPLGGGAPRSVARKLRRALYAALADVAGADAAGIALDVTLFLKGER